MTCTSPALCGALGACDCAPTGPAPVVAAPGARTLAEVEAAGGYPIIYADPPWAYEDANCAGRGAATKYDTMASPAIGDLPVERLAARDAVLFLWATWPKIEDVFPLMRRWGFTYRTIAFNWVKTRNPKTEGGPAQPFFGLGRWTRGNTEPCLLGIRGKPKRINAGVSQLLGLDDWQSLEGDHTLVSPIGRHSAKPRETRDRILRLMGDQPRIELFARERAPGWDAWGNEIPSSVVL